MDRGGCPALRMGATERGNELNGNSFSCCYLLDRAPLGVFRATVTGRIVGSNQKFLDLLGFSSLEELNQWPETGRRVATKLLSELAKTIVEEEGQLDGFELGWQAADGTLRWLRETVWAVRDEAGETVFFEGWVADISKSKQAEEGSRRLEAERRRLESASLQSTKLQSLGLVAGGVAHDFNNILTSIFGLTHLALQEANIPGQLRKDLSQLLEMGNRAKGLVQQILAFNRNDPVEADPVRVGPIVEKTMKLLRSVVPSNVQVRTSVAPGPDFVRVDPTKIHQIVANLVTNAADAMGEKGGLLEVTVRQAAEETHRTAGKTPGLAIRVSDNGCGMPPELMQRIFDPFFTTKLAGKGVGLGLFVTRRIVEEAGGVVNVQSELGKGTVFEVCLPLADGAGAKTGRPKLAQPKGCGETILLVDDEEGILQTTTRILERWGYQVVKSADGKEALETFLAAPRRFDLVITDQTMPGLPGDRLAQRILAVRPDLPIVLATGYSDKIGPDQARELGIKAFLMKPVDIREMGQTISTLCGRGDEASG